MPTLEALTRVYWLTCGELQAARALGNAIAEAEALYELTDLAAYAPESLRRRCLSHVPLIRAKASRT